MSGEIPGIRDRDGGREYQQRKRKSKGTKDEEFKIESVNDSLSIDSSNLDKYKQTDKKNNRGYGEDPKLKSALLKQINKPKKR